MGLSGLQLALEGRGWGWGMGTRGRGGGVMLLAGHSQTQVTNKLGPPGDGPTPPVPPERRVRGGGHLAGGGRGEVQSRASAGRSI